MANVELARPETVEFSAVGGLFRTRSVTVADTHSIDQRILPTNVWRKCNTVVKPKLQRISKQKGVSPAQRWSDNDNDIRSQYQAAGGAENDT